MVAELFTLSLFISKPLETREVTVDKLMMIKNPLTVDNYSLFIFKVFRSKSPLKRFLKVPSA